MNVGHALQYSYYRPVGPICGVFSVVAKNRQVAASIDTMSLLFDMCQAARITIFGAR